MSEQEELSVEKRTQLARESIDRCVADISQYLVADELTTAAPAAAALMIMITSLVYLKTTGTAPTANELLAIVHSVILQEFSTLVASNTDPLQQANLTDN